jgi:hypothetical protein
MQNRATSTKISPFAYWRRRHDSTHPLPPSTTKKSASPQQWEKALSAKGQGNLFLSGHFVYYAFGGLAAYYGGVAVFGHGGVGTVMVGGYGVFGGFTGAVGCVFGGGGGIVLLLVGAGSGSEGQRGGYEQGVEGDFHGV